VTISTTVIGYMQGAAFFALINMPAKCRRAAVGKSI
jgi:hypothetical protein